MTEEQQGAASLQTYSVTVERQDWAHARATAHGHALTLGVRRGDPMAGFNAAETLLAALGVCLITNVNALAAKMRLRVDGVRVEIEGDRREIPAGIVQIRYRLVLDSPERPDRLERLHELALKWGTVTNTLVAGVTVHGELAKGDVEQWKE